MCGTCWCAGRVFIAILRWAELGSEVQSKVWVALQRVGDLSTMAVPVALLGRLLVCAT